MIFIINMYANSLQSWKGPNLKLWNKVYYKKGTVYWKVPIYTYFLYSKRLSCCKVIYTSLICPQQHLYIWTNLSVNYKRSWLYNIPKLCNKKLLGFTHLVRKKFHWCLFENFFFFINLGILVKDLIHIVCTTKHNSRVENVRRKKNTERLPSSKIYRSRSQPSLFCKFKIKWGIFVEDLTYIICTKNLNLQFSQQ